MLCLRQISASRIVLDGELIVWNKMRGVFEPFGGLRSTVNAANEGAAPDKVSRNTVWIVLSCGLSRSGG